MMYATGGRSVPQNWATAAKWWRKAAEAGDQGAQWNIGACYYYGRGVDQDVARAMVWIRKSTAQGNAAAVNAVLSGLPGQAFREDILRFTNAGSAPTRHAAAHNFAEEVHKNFLGPSLQMCNDVLKESDSTVPHQSLRDSMWVEFMQATGLSDEELELATYSLRTCTFCGSNSAPLRNCSLCGEVRYCIGTDCQHADLNTSPAAESHKVLCPRIFVRGSKGRIRRA